MMRKLLFLLMFIPGFLSAQQTQTLKWVKTDTLKGRTGTGKIVLSDSSAYILYPAGGRRNLDSVGAGGGGGINTAQNLGTTHYLPFKDTASGVIRLRTLFENNTNLGFTAGDSTELTLTASPTFTTTTTDSLRSTGGVKLANTAKVVIDGMDASQVAGEVSVFENGGELNATSRHSIALGLDNDANANASFVVKKDGTSGTTIFSVAETSGVVIQTGSQYRGGLGALLTIKGNSGMTPMTVYGDSNKPGLQGWNDRLRVLGDLSVEEHMWVDEALYLTRPNVSNKTTLTANSIVGATTFTVADTTNITADHDIYIGTAGSDIDILRVVSKSGLVVTISPPALYPHSIGDTVQLDRWRGNFGPISNYEPRTPGGNMFLGMRMKAAETAYDSQTIAVAEHVNLVNPLGSAVAPMVLYGGTVDTTAPASMSVIVSAGQFLRGGGGTQGYTVLTTRQTVTHDASDNDSARIDLLYWNYAGAVKIVKGANELVPVAPTLPSGGTIIAWDTISAGVTSVTLAKTVDKRQTSMRLYPADGVVGVGTDTVVGQYAGANYLSVRGTTFGAMEFTTEAADATAANIGIIHFTDKNSTAANQRVASIQAQLRGGTANNRGGRLIFNIKSDGASGLNEAAHIDTNRSFNFGGGNVIVNKKNTAEVEIDGSDATPTSGVNSIYEFGGDLRLTTRNDFLVGLDNDANVTTGQFYIKSNGPAGTTVFSVSENGTIDAHTTTADTNSYTTTATSDTIVISGATTADKYFLSYRAAPNANDLLWFYTPKADTVIFTRAASGTSGIGYAWWRVR